MKKLFIIIITMLFICSCSKEEKATVFKSNIAKQTTTVYQVNQNKILLPENNTSFKEENTNISNQVNDNKPLIVIDAGHQAHGNNEQEPIGPGASETKAKVTTGATGISTDKLESEINLEVALKLQKKLQEANYQVIMIRTSQDVNLSNSERAKIANDNNADAFIRLHCNSADTSSASGTLTMAPSLNNPYCNQIASSSYNLSKKVVDKICNRTGSKNRGVMISDTMSGINWCKVPVTIIEMGFLSNPQEDMLLSDSIYQDKIVDGIVEGINEFIK